MNLRYFRSLSKRIYFGKNVKIDGGGNLQNLIISDRVVLDDNVEIRNRTKEKLFIGANTSINRNTVIRGKVCIAENVLIAPNCMIIGANHRFDDITKNIKDQGVEIKGINIEQDVWIGANSCILDGVTIGHGTVIGAGAVVTKSIPPMSVAVGNPCKVIRSRI